MNTVISGVWFGAVRDRPQGLLRVLHGQQCNVTYTKSGQDFPGSNPVVSHFFTLIISY